MLHFTDLLHVGRSTAVYLGRCEGVCGFERAVAIKVMRPSIAAQPVQVQAFFAEARAAARVRHPSVVDVHAFVESEAGTALVMQLVDGWSLQTVLSTAAIRSRAIPIELAATIASAATESVTAVHDGGLLHRDIVPDNLLVTRSGHVVLIDFGAAVSIHHSPDAGAQVPMTARAFAAPELAAGRADARSDVYSLGMILSTLVTPVTHGTKSPTMGLPGALEAVIRAATSSDPDDRPSTAAQLGRDLEAAERPASRARLGAFLDELFEPRATPAPVRCPEPRADFPRLDSSGDTRIRLRRG